MEVSLSLQILYLWDSIPHTKSICTEVRPNKCSHSIWKSCVMMHSVSLNDCLSYISQLVQPVNNSSRCQGLPSSSSAKYAVQRTRTKFAECAISVVGPSVWNSLPADLRLETDTAVFKHKPKNYLFHCVFTQ